MPDAVTRGQFSVRAPNTGMVAIEGIAASVMSGQFSQSVNLISMLTMGVIQVVVHLVCFLHMNTSSEGRWNLVAFLFTALIIVMLVGLAIWIMVNADMLMMPWMFQ